MLIKTIDKGSEDILMIFWEMKETPSGAARQSCSAPLLIALSLREDDLITAL